MKINLKDTSIKGYSNKGMIEFVFHNNSILLLRYKGHWNYLPKPLETQSYFLGHNEFRTPFVNNRKYRYN